MMLMTATRVSIVTSKNNCRTSYWYGNTDRPHEVSWGGKTMLPFTQLVTLNVRKL